MFQIMKRARKKVITFETRSQTIIYRSCARYEVRCDLCGSTSISLLPEGATDEQLRRHESTLSTNMCLDDGCRQMLEADTLPQITI